MRGDFPQALLAGHQRFRTGRFAADATRLAELAQGQAPHAMVIGCCDSRVAPEFVFGATPGALFVLRSIAAWVAPGARAATNPQAARSSDNAPAGQHAPGTALALEYAVRRLEVPHLVVLAHSDCGGVRAALDPQAAGLLDPLAARGLDGLHAALEDLRADAAPDAAARQTRAEHHVLARSLENVRSFAFVNDAERAGALSLHGAWFDIGSCSLHLLNSQTGAVEAPQAVAPQA